MFSYLRPHHRRTPSNPTSPAETSHSFEPPLRSNSPHDHGHPPRSHDVDPHISSSSLPAIAQVSSTDSTFDYSGRRIHDGESRTANWDTPGSNTRPGDINGYNNHRQKPAYHPTQRPDSAGDAVGPGTTNSQYPRDTYGESYDRSKASAPNQYFTTATDLQNKHIEGGRRQPASRRSSGQVSGYQTSSLEPIQPKQGKARLNLLNPMSLLARRRTSQAIPQLLPQPLKSGRGAETYDFQIKGKFVHDFSAPRTQRRNQSYNDVSTLDGEAQRQSSTQQNPTTTTGDELPTSPWSGGNHTPVFTENFEEEQYPAAGPHVRKASDLTDLHVPRPPFAQGSKKPAASNSTPQDGGIINHQGHGRQLSDRTSPSDVGPAVPPKPSRMAPSKPTSIGTELVSSPPKAASSKKGRPRNVSEVSSRDVIPKHMKSTSSRFSFDMIGAAGQERLLEERHRQKALEKTSVDGFEGFDDAYVDEYDYDDMMDDDGLEERIPGVNTDFDEQLDDYEDSFEEQIPGVNADAADDYPEEDIPNHLDLAGFSFQQPSAPMSPNSPFIQTPRDADGQVIGFAMTKESPLMAAPQTVHEAKSSPLSSGQVDAATLGIEDGLYGLGLQGVETQSPVEPEIYDEEGMEGFPRVDGLEDDDLYFDDGIISGSADIDEVADFDESVFDNVDTDEYGRPVKSFSTLPTLYSPPMLTADPSPSFNKAIDSAANVHEEMNSPSAVEIHHTLAPQASVALHKNPLEPTQTLTQDSLAAYQTALAAAARQAEASGKFRRGSTPTFQPLSEHELDPGSQPGLIPDSTRTSHYEAFSPSYELEDDFDYDDAMEDDAIIAAANAEALANDSDGFYGQEFGFFSAPGGGEAEYVNGGYFGPRGVEGLVRSTSGRIASREPNLTPITERSEYSNRNSFMGAARINQLEGMTSPGLAQLMRREDYESDLSLEGLLKLRRGAWGGSQASLHSSAGSPRSAGLDEGSPVGSLPPWSAGSQNQSFSSMAQPSYVRRNSGFSGISVASESSPIHPGLSYGRRNSTGMAMEIGPRSEQDSSPSSPTFTKHIPNHELDILSPKSVSTSEMASPSPNTEHHGRGEGEERFRKHRHTGSSESISYLKEADPVTGERWILERRRTAESGEVEVLGREVVSGGRI